MIFFDGIDRSTPVNEDAKCIELALEGDRLEVTIILSPRLEPLKIAARKVIHVVDILNLLTPLDEVIEPIVIAGNG